jgi:hypothetical protein
LLVEDLDSLPEFAGLVASMESDEARWLAFLDHPTAERELPQPWLQNRQEVSKEAAQLMKMIVINALRPDRFVAAAKELVATTFSEEAT